MSLKGTGCEVGDWIHRAQDTVQWRVSVNTAMNFRVPEVKAFVFELRVPLIMGWIWGGSVNTKLLFITEKG
jgi:hypothetical protein